MATVGIKVLKSRLSEYVRAASAGETVQVTDRGRVVAELVSPASRKLASLSPALARGVREGWFTPAVDPGPLAPDDPAREAEGAIPFDQLMADLARDREDR